MVRKTGQIIRRGSSTWSASTSAAIRKRGDAGTSANSSMARCVPRRRTSTTCSQSATSVITFVRYIRRGIAKDRERTTRARLGGIYARGLFACVPAHAGHSGNQG